MKPYRETAKQYAGYLYDAGIRCANDLIKKNFTQENAKLTGLIILECKSATLRKEFISEQFELNEAVDKLAWGAIAFGSEIENYDAHRQLKTDFFTDILSGAIQYASSMIDELFEIIASERLFDDQQNKHINKYEANA